MILLTDYYLIIYLYFNNCYKQTCVYDGNEIIISFDVFKSFSANMLYTVSVEEER